MTGKWLAAAATLVSLSIVPQANAGCVKQACVRGNLETVTPILPVDLKLAAFTQVGEYFAFDRVTNVFSVGGGGEVAYSSPFALNVGGGPTTAVFVREDGIATIGASLGSRTFVSTTDLSRLGVPVIAPFYANLDQNSAASAYRGVVIQQGIADPAADAAGNFAIADARAALRITWYGFDVGGTAAAPGTPTYLQLLLIDEGGGDFDFRFRAGAPGSATANSPAGAIGGFAFGDNYYQFDTPYDASTVGGFAVRDGEIVTAAVPEASTWATMMVGLGLVGGWLRGRPGRRRMYPAPRPA